MSQTIERSPRASVGSEPVAMPPYSDIPKIEVIAKRDGVAPGYLFISPQSILEPEAPHGPQIVDDHGRLVWFRPLPQGTYATNVRVQRYRGEPVLTWWEGTATDTGVGHGVGYIADLNYRIIATVEAGGEHRIDLHELLLTDRDTAIVVSYQTVPHDLTPIGGDEDQLALDSVVEEVDIATGEVLLHWSGLEAIPLHESNMPPKLIPGHYDHLHVNAIAVDVDDNLLITARSNSAVYKIDRATGELIWKFGSGYSTFALDVGVRCNWQHDAQPAGEDTYRIFDNGANNFFEGYESRVVWVRLDTDSKTATHVRTLFHPERLSSLAEGNAQQLPNGNVLVGWGRAGRISEFAPGGDLVFDASTPAGNGWTTYRAFRHEWSGRPDVAPEARVGDGQVSAYWNGATGVHRWRLLAGRSEETMHEVATAEWDGLDTPIPLPDGVAADVVRVEALDADGAVIASSAVRATDN